MKKVYSLCALALLSCVFVSAQIVQSKSFQGKNIAKARTSANARHSGPTGANTPASVIWTNNFDTPSDWTIDHAAGTIGDWVIGTSGPNGMFPINPIFTQGNFAKFDSDSICSSDQIGNITTTNPIDLTGHSDVRLSFAQYYRRFHDTSYVYISHDNVNWTRFDANPGLLSNDFNSLDDASNPDMVYIDISAVAGNQDSVYIRFQYLSPDSDDAGVPDLSAGCGYAWMIDDVSISDILGTDGRIQAKANAGEYASVSIIQPQAIQLKGQIVNWGLNPFTGAKIMFKVYDSNGLVYTDSSNASGSINKGDTSAVLTAVGSFIPLTIDHYNIEQTVMLTGDADITNDVTSYSLAVSDSVMARDILPISDGNVALATAIGFNSPGSGILGEMYHVYNASQFSSATFFLSNPTVGDHVSVSVFSVTGGVPDALLGSTNVFTIAGPDTVTLPFPVWIDVPAGDYFVGVNQLDTNFISVGATSKYYTPNKGFFQPTGGTWAPFEPNLAGITLVLRINNPSGTLLSTKKVESVSAFNVYPNPSTGVVFITGNGSTEKNVTVEVIDNLGKTVKTVRFDQITTNQIDLSTLPAGLYNISIKSEKGTMNKSIVLE